MPSDLIYREDAKDYARHAIAKGLNVLEYLDEVPAADSRPVVTCAGCKYNNACLTQAFVEDESRVPFDRSTFFCADGKREDDA